MSSSEFQPEKWKYDLVLQYFEQGGGKDESPGDEVVTNKVINDQDSSCGCVPGPTTSQQKTLEVGRKDRRTGGKLMENMSYEHLSGDHGRSCVSLVLKMGSSCLEEDQTGLSKRLARVEGLVAGTNIRWSHRSSLGPQVRQVRLDLAFWSSCEARTFYKAVMSDLQLSHGRRLVTGLLLTEADMGYELEPVLSEQDLLFIQSSDYCSNIFRTGVDCWVELDESDDVQYRFPSITDLNLFLFNKSGRTDTRALGSLRNNRVVRQLMPDKEGFFRLQTSELSLSSEFPTFDKLQVEPHFEMKSLKGNFLKFPSKLDLFRFLLSEDAGKLKHLKFDESKIVENKALTIEIELERLGVNEEIFKEALLKKENKINQLTKALELKEVDIENVKKEKGEATLQLEEALASLDRIHELSLSVIQDSECTDNSVDCKDQENPVGSSKKMYLI